MYGGKRIRLKPDRGQPSTVDYRSGILATAGEFPTGPGTAGRPPTDALPTRYLYDYRRSQTDELGDDALRSIFHTGISSRKSGSAETASVSRPTRGRTGPDQTRQTTPDPSRPDHTKPRQARPDHTALDPTRPEPIRSKQPARTEHIIRNYRTTELHADRKDPTRPNYTRLSPTRWPTRPPTVPDRRHNVWES